MNGAAQAPLIAVPALSLTDLIGGLLFSSLGFVAFTYGKRMGYWTPMLCGIALMLLPLLLADAPLLVVSAALTGTAIIFRRN
ncbi:MAG: hypothetical protein DLM52_02360 [Chthoniobacterales bacterium]|nr:MAG: hypothetical protein DLM52_02360 [Chthoniobacterales bacterium]